MAESYTTLRSRFPTPVYVDVDQIAMTETTDRRFLTAKIAREDRGGISRIMARKRAERQHGVSLQLIDSMVDPITGDEVLTWEVQQ